MPGPLVEEDAPRSAFSGSRREGSRAITPHSSRRNLTNLLSLTHSTEEHGCSVCLICLIPRTPPRPNGRAGPGYGEIPRAALRGWKFGIRGHSSFFVHFFCAALVMAAAGALQCSLEQWALLLLCIGIVLTTELFNSAIETFHRGLDDLTKGYAPGRRLDIAAGQRGADGERDSGMCRPAYFRRPTLAFARLGSECSLPNLSRHR